MDRDFAPAWLKVQSGPNSKQETAAISTSATDTVSLRPQYLQRIDTKPNATDQPTSPPLSQLEQNFRDQLDFRHHVPPKEPLRAAFAPHSRAHSLDIDDNSENATANSNYRRSYQRNGVAGDTRTPTYARPHSQNDDFRELAAFNKHQPPAKDASSHSNTNGGSGPVNGDANGKPDTFQEEFPSLATGTTASVQTKSVWDSAQAKAKVLYGRTTPNLTTLTAKLAPKVTDSAKDVVAKKPTLVKKEASGLTIGATAKVLPPTLFPTKKSWTSNGASAGGNLTPVSMEILVKNTIKTRVSKPLTNGFSESTTMQRTSRTSSISSTQSEKSDLSSSQSKSREESVEENGPKALSAENTGPVAAMVVKPDNGVDINGHRNRSLDDNFGAMDFAPKNGENGGEHVRREMLSSSLEEEVRLLRQMGWSDPNEEEVPPLTDDEVREFQRLVSARTNCTRLLRPRLELLRNNINNTDQAWPRNNLIASVANDDDDDDDSSSSSSDEDEEKDVEVDGFVML